MAPLFWKLIHEIHRYEIGGLSTERAVGFLANFGSEERSKWWAWREGFSGWVSSLECSELQVTPGTKPWNFQDSPVSKAQPTPPPFRAVVQEQGKERRKHPRIDLRVKVVVVQEGRTFRSHSKNLSQGGLLLEHQVPWSMPGQTCQVFLTNESTSEHIEFMAKVISDASNPFRISFETPDPQFESTLQAWLETAQKPVKKAA